jgi:hypothetical protein
MAIKTDGRRGYPPSIMTQRKLAGGYIRTWLSDENESTEWLSYLGGLIDKAQNGGDGSLSEAQWTALRDFHQAMVNAELKSYAVLDALGLDEEGNTRR